MIETALLHDAVDFDGFRAQARRLLAGGVEPERVQWQVRGAAESELAFGAAPAAPSAPADAPPSASAEAPSAAPLRVTASFIALAQSVALHRDPSRFALLYRLLWRLREQPALLRDPLDAQLQQARLMAAAVRRDMHKMRAFVRFRPLPVEAGAPAWHVAWFEPQHHILRANAPFFVRRFTGMAWAILTPDGSLRWDGQRLEAGPAAQRSDAPPADAGEALWIAYYEHVFNPARLKLKAMQKEMPRRYWRNLPEAASIASLAAASAQRHDTMLEQAPTLPSRRIVPLAKRINIIDDAGADDAPARLQRLRADALGCRECPLGAAATQTVWGEGPPDASLMLVGEQPGDREDLEGRPFVGPAGALLDRALAALGWDRAQLYLTNAVKHFKYEPRGRRRMHKTPAQREADACAHWLESEIELVRPRAIVALGATAARQLLGRPVAVLVERGRWQRRADGVPVLVTLHPAALLRGERADLEAQFERWLEDLRLACPLPAVLPDNEQTGGPA